MKHRKPGSGVLDPNKGVFEEGGNGLHVTCYPRSSKIMGENQHWIQEHG
jgi:hypothetical protein